MLTVNDHDLAVVGAETGAAVLRERFGATHTRFDKGGGDFATEVDIAAEKAILEVLRHARPDNAVRVRKVDRPARRAGSGLSIRCAAR